MKYFFQFKTIFFLFFIGFSVFFIPPVYRLKWGGIELITWDKDHGKIVQKMKPKNSSWQKVEETSPFLISAIIGAEDTFFYTHPGIDINSIRKSFKENYRAGYIKGGASTITQQVVKIAFLSQKKSYLRKAREVTGALLLEMLLNKNEILAWHLNLAYFGNGFRGVKKASEGYFQKKPQNLSLNESIYLALLLPSPNHYGSQILKRSLKKKAQLRFYAILKELKNKKEITSLQWSEALNTGNFGNPLIIEEAP